MRPLTIRGYCDPLAVSPGDDVNFYVSCDHPGQVTPRLVRVVLGDENPDGPGAKEIPVDGMSLAPFDGVAQRTQAGGHIVVRSLPSALDESNGFSVHLFAAPTTPAAGEQALIGHWSQADSRGWELGLVEGQVFFRVGDGTVTTQVETKKALFAGTWYSICASYDPDKGLTVSQMAVVGSCNGRFGPVVDLDSDSTQTLSGSFPLAPTAASLVIAAVAESEMPGREWVTHQYSGKIESPKLLGTSELSAAETTSLAEGAVPSTVVAYWDFAEGITRNGIPGDQAVEIIAGCHGQLMNTPDRAMTGRTWDDTEHHFVHAPDQYGAIWFHPDSIDDCRWDVSLTVTIPEDLKSGVYALEVDQGRDVERIVFFLRPNPNNRKKILFLASTFTYLAYANQQVAVQAAVAQSVFAHTAILHDNEIEVHERSMEYGLSTYDYHADGKGVAYSTWRRPIMNMRPQHRYCYSTLWNFTTDLHLLNWMEQMGFEYDVLTDHDVHEQGADLLKHYNVVVTASHPEYYSTPLVDAWEHYIASGGRGMYLGGNGMYWVAVPNPDRPYLIEVRRGEQGDQGWRANPGECFHSHSGEKGGLWRLRGRAAQRIWGVGYTAHAFGTSAPYFQLPDAQDPRLAWMMEGIPFDDPIGDTGLIGNGAAGHEFDRYDLTLGTPPNTMLLASSFGHSAYDMVLPEDQYFPSSGMNGMEHPNVHGDITYFTSRGGGAMFAAASMTWVTSLPMNNYDNHVSRLTGNVLRRFASSVPLPEVD